MVARPELEVFATAIITGAVTKAMEKLTEEDKRGREPFASDKEMYQTYTGYYQRPVGPESPVTIYRFRVLEIDPAYKARFETKR